MFSKYYRCNNNSIKLALMLVGLVVLSSAKAEEISSYKINPGDVLEISVWKEEALQREVRVLPDGIISFPLAGHINVSGKSVMEIQKILITKLSAYISDPVVNISVKSVDGNVVYVIGQVNSPGTFIMYKPMTAMQMLSLAGGLTPFAKANSIVILRGQGENAQAIEFEYGELEDGDDLDKNHMLQSGDVIVVP